MYKPTFSKWPIAPADVASSSLEGVELRQAQVQVQIRPNYGTIHHDTTQPANSASPTFEDVMSPRNEKSLLLPPTIRSSSSSSLPTAYPAPSYVTVGLPVDPPSKLRTSYSEANLQSRVGELSKTGGFSLGVDTDLEGARIAARNRALQDNEEFDRKKGISESQARQRVEEEARALQIAMLHAKRRESEGLDMMPHPGNHLRQGSREKAVFSSGMAVAYGALAEPGQYDRYSTAGAQGKDVGNAGALGATVESQGPSAYGSSTGGYQTREYETSSYQVSEYKSVYDT